MLKLTQIKLPYDHPAHALGDRVCKQLRVPAKQIADIRVLRRALDCRRKPQIEYVYTVGVTLRDEAAYLQRNRSALQWLYQVPCVDLDAWIPQKINKTAKRPIVVGTGPAGLFAALTLAKAGLRPIVFERGAKVSERNAAVQAFGQGGRLDTDTNIQFGEGGAGTFSDGKLNTGIGSQFVPTVLNEFVRYGAPQEILFDAKPHIGTDLLQNVVRNLRKAIVAYGGEVRFRSRVVDLRVADGKLRGLLVQSPEDGAVEWETDACVLAIGHSARDTFEMLRGYVRMQPKAFAIGVRIEHAQAWLDRAQYGGAQGLPAADYKLNVQTETGRGCYTFCMCPGGSVVAAASEDGGVVTNGMSLHARDGANANSALLVGVTPDDYGSDDVLAGVEFQRRWERAAYAIAGDYRAPAQRVGDLLRGRETATFADVAPTYPRGVVGADMRAVLPPYVTDTLAAALPALDRKLNGFAHPDAVLTGVETRSSSPIRILRDDGCQSSLVGLYPCGEGAGYAGGITSAAADGIRVALAYLQGA